MAIFPRVQSPCPYKGDLSAIMDCDVCRMCQRQVFDLDGFSDAERVAFMKGCAEAGERVCVRYSFRPALAAAAMAAAVIAAPTAASACDATGELVVVVGGIDDPANTEYVEDASDAAIPALPVVYETGDQSNATPRGALSAAPTQEN